MVMSDKQNDLYLENCRETFEEAVMVENWALARAVIDDLKSGRFHKQADVLNDLLAQNQNDS